MKRVSARLRRKLITNNIKCCSINEIKSVPHLSTDQPIEEGEGESEGLEAEKQRGRRSMICMIPKVVISTPLRLICLVWRLRSSL